ncbi:hypothetical protein VNO77_19656 [Canavalia gladiata]|uniref:Uncharacterized protein n=1 Tax=Canavalia gladiata TaxID=3824 RepID=A0AAN9QKQ1_CANGL
MRGAHVLGIVKRESRAPCNIIRHHCPHPSFDHELPYHKIDNRACLISCSWNVRLHSLRRSRTDPCLQLISSLLFQATFNDYLKLKYGEMPAES